MKKLTHCDVTRQGTRWCSRTFERSVSPTDIHSRIFVAGPESSQHLSTRTTNTDTHTVASRTQGERAPHHLPTEHPRGRTCVQPVVTHCNIKLSPNAKPPSTLSFLLRTAALFPTFPTSTHERQRIPSKKNRLSRASLQSRRPLLGAHASDTHVNASA
jgi:hypothetical protein